MRADQFAKKTKREEKKQPAAARGDPSSSARPIPVGQPSQRGQGASDNPKARDATPPRQQPKPKNRPLTPDSSDYEDAEVKRKGSGKGTLAKGTRNYQPEKGDWPTYKIPVPKQQSAGGDSGGASSSVPAHVKAGITKVEETIRTNRVQTY